MSSSQTPSFQTHLDTHPAIEAPRLGVHAPEHVNDDAGCPEPSAELLLPCSERHIASDDCGRVVFRHVRLLKDGHMLRELMG